VGLSAAVIIGLLAGVIVVGSVIFFDRVKIDDPVGAISVHLTCGIWGTLAVGIFAADKSFVTQLIGVASYGAATVVSATILFGAIKAVMGLRVSEEEEIEGLDYGEHGMHAYDLGGIGGGMSVGSSKSAGNPGLATQTQFAASENL
jgi:Amt family ammonium transporter